MLALAPIGGGTCGLSPRQRSDCRLLLQEWIPIPRATASPRLLPHSVGLWAPGFDLGGGVGILENEVLLGDTGIMDGVWLQLYSWAPLRQNNCLPPPR